VSQAIRRLEDGWASGSIDRSSRDGTLTDAGNSCWSTQTVCCDWSTRRRRGRDLRDVKKGRV
jgi:hypothetical protein